MNLLIINSAKEWGGTEKWALYTASGLAALGHRVYFGCRDTLFDHRVQPPVHVVKFPFANNFDLLTVFSLWLFCITRKIDVVIPSKQREYWLSGLAAKLTFKTKVAGMFGIDRPIHNLRNWIAFCKLFDIVFVNSKSISRALSKTKAFDTSKCKLVYVGVEQFKVSPDIRLIARNDLGISDKTILILGIGRMAPQKGFDFAIDAFTQLYQKMPTAKLCLVGPGDSVVYREQAIKSRIADNIIFTGFRSDIHNLIQAADIYWLTSRSEGVPNTMLEAMMARIPVVSFDVAGVTEIISNDTDGIVVPMGDIVSLVEKTILLLDNPVRAREIGDNGCLTVTTSYSMDKMCADTEKYLQEITTR